MINERAQKQIGQLKEKCKIIDPLVLIDCITYNQEKYIYETLEGIVRQKTNFPFVALVHDDASTDRNVEIIKEYANNYPDIIFPIFEKENQYLKGNRTFKLIDEIINEAISVTGAKYVALCEGDDYWIDPYKLQKQVDYLEANPEYGMVYGLARQYVQKDGKFIQDMGKDYKNIQELISQPYQIPTASILYNIEIKKKAFEKYIGNRAWLMGDYPLSLAIASYSKIKFLPEELSVYRILENSTCHFTHYEDIIKMLTSILDLRIHFIEKLNLNYLKESIIQDYNKELFFYSLNYNKYHKAYNYLKKIEPSEPKLKILKKWGFSYYSFLFFISLFKIKNLIFKKTILKSFK